MTLPKIGLLDSFEWLPHGNVMIVDLGMGQLGIAVDTKLKSNDVKSLLRLLMAFRHYVEELFMDSPIIELIVSQINKQQVNLLIEMLKSTRKFTDNQTSEDRSLISSFFPETIPGPFFTNLKKLTITSQARSFSYLNIILMSLF